MPEADDMIVSHETGLWLPPKKIALREREAGIEKLHTAAQGEHAPAGGRELHHVAARLLERTSVSKSGCFEGGLRARQRAGSWALKLAELEQRTIILDTEFDVPSLSLCGNDNCYNTRHHHFTPGGINRPTFNNELNPNYYMELDDGRVGTIWGDILPTVADSVRAFADFQRANFPFTSYEDSLLTASPISQISVHPVSGCWETFRYETNTTNTKNPKNGYGLMYDREFLETMWLDDENYTQYRRRRGDRLAHLVLWRLYQRGNRRTYTDINHRCFHPRCCNPAHLEEITPEQNQEHARHARNQIRALEQERPEVEGSFLSPHARRVMAIRTMHVYLTHTDPNYPEPVASALAAA